MGYGEDERVSRHVSPYSARLINLTLERVMKLFSGIQYVKIDLADCFGLDKLNFEDRLQQIESMFSDSDVKGKTSKELLELLRTKQNLENEPKALGALMAWKDYLEGKPSGYLVTKDGSASGIQILSALAKCPMGLFNTGLLGSDDGSGNERKDVYTIAYKRYLELIDKEHIKERSDIKQALMTSFYGSKATPRRVLGEEGLIPFREVCAELLPGAFDLKESLVECWNSKSTHHTWINADGFVSHVPVLVENTYNLNVAGLDIPFTLKEQGKQESGLSNAANLTHAVDALVLRELVRRCNFNEPKITYIGFLLNQLESMDKAYTEKEAVSVEQRKEMGQLGNMIHLFEETGFCTVRICEYITSITDLMQLSQNHRTKLHRIIKMMCQQGSFEVVTVHDQFGCLADEMNYVRHWYKELIAEIVESSMLEFLVNQISPIKFKLPDSYNQNPQLTARIADLVRKSDYGLA